MERAGLARLLGTSVAVQTRRPSLIAVSEPAAFMRDFARAVAGTGDVFLGDPAWSGSERAHVEALVGERPRVAPGDSAELGWLMIPTGGTSGKIRFARHDAETVSAAVRGFARHFGMARVNALGVLPLHHVSGLMAWLRCALTGGSYRAASWREIDAGTLPDIDERRGGWTVSLVATQLERLLRSPAGIAWLRRFSLILLGGGPAWPELLDRAAGAKLPIAPSYGMTETAAMVSALHPSEFLNGARSSGRLLPHMHIGFDDEGRIILEGQSLFRGYFPEWREKGPFATQDGGYLDANGELHVTGRRDAAIISGGEKVDPGEVEAVLRGTGEFADIVVVGIPDAEWGQRVVAVFPKACDPDMARVREAMAGLLSPHKHPKAFVGIREWPGNPQGKVNRAEAMRRVLTEIERQRLP